MKKVSAFLIAIAAVLAACSEKPVEPIRIGFIGGLSGPNSDNALMARSNSPTLGHPKFPQAGPPDYDDSGATAMRAAASLRR